MIEYKSEDGTISILVEQNVLMRIEKICFSSAYMETGGIIFGKYSDDLTTAIITGISEAPPDSKRGRTWFNRGTRGLRKKLHELWKQGLYYLGEWHFHPGSSPTPSAQDIRQMFSIAKDCRFKCPEPILLVTGERQNKYTYSLHIFMNGKKIVMIPV